MFTICPSDKEFIDSLEFLLKLFGGIGGLILFIVGFLRYSKSQEWKRKEFIANEIKEMNKDSIVRNAMYILDWDKRKIELFPEDPDFEKRYYVVDRELLKSALLSHKLKGKFKKEEVRIRDTFDHFFDELERLNQFIESNLISDKEIGPYLKYWIKVISEDLDPKVKNIVFHYINEYNFSGVQQLFKKFNKDIFPTTNLESCNEVLNLSTNLEELIAL
jgi:hypothetical protein